MGSTPTTCTTQGGAAMLKVIGLILMLIGTIFIYDARKIVKKTFGFGDQNEGTLGLKIVGFLLAITGAFVVYFNM